VPVPATTARDPRRFACSGPFHNPFNTNLPIREEAAAATTIRRVASRSAGASMPPVRLERMTKKTAMLTVPAMLSASARPRYSRPVAGRMAHNAVNSPTMMVVIMVGVRVSCRA